MPEMRYTVKDSIFTFVFKQPEYARKLYLALHPEDDGVTEADCKLVTLENVLTTGLYNDFGIQVRDTLILLVEAQSVFSVNIALRIFLYLAATYKEYAEDYKLNLYGTAAVTIPRPELYVVYTGDRKDIPEFLYLSDLYEGEGSVEVKVRVLLGNGTGDIIDQYVRFCKISDEERKKHGRSKKAVEEILRRCIEEDVLSPFLATRQKEVAEIMVTLFDQEKVMEIHDYHIAETARRDGILKGRAEGRAEGHAEGRAEGRAEGHAEGRAEGHAEGRLEGIFASVQSLMTSMGLTLEQAMNALSVSEADRSRCRSLMKNSD